MLLNVLVALLLTLLSPASGLKRSHPLIDPDPEYDPLAYPDPDQSHPLTDPVYAVIGPLPQLRGASGAKKYLVKVEDNSPQPEQEGDDYSLKGQYDFSTNPPEGYQCHHWTEKQKKYLQYRNYEQKNITCRSTGWGYVWSQGNQKLVPGCGHCWCCKPEYFAGWPASYLVTSSGGVKTHYCEVLGKYEQTGRKTNFPGRKCNPRLPVYKHESKNFYLYVQCDYWVIANSPSPNVANIFALKSGNVITPPISGWKFWSSGKRISDATMKVTVGTALKDNHKLCEYWSHKGECGNNPAYMLPNCKKSCNSCKAT